MSEKQATLWDTLSNIRSAWIIMVGVVSVIFFFPKEHHINIDQNRRIEAIEARLMRQEGEVQELASIKIDVEYIKRDQAILLESIRELRDLFEAVVKKGGV